MKLIKDGGKSYLITFLILIGVCAVIKWPIPIIATWLFLWTFEWKPWRMFVVRLFKGIWSGILFVGRLILKAFNTIAQRWPVYVILKLVR